MCFFFKLKWTYLGKYILTLLFILYIFKLTWWLSIKCVSCLYRSFAVPFICSKKRAGRWNRSGCEVISLQDVSDNTLRLLRNWSHAFICVLYLREREEKWGWEKCGWPFPALSWWCAQRTEKRNFLDWTPLVFCWCRKDILFLMLHPIFWDQLGDPCEGPWAEDQNLRGRASTALC